MKDFLKKHTKGCIVAFFVVLFGACGLYMWHTLTYHPQTTAAQISAPATADDSKTDNKDTSSQKAEPTNRNWDKLVSEYGSKDNLVVTEDDTVTDADPAVKAKFEEGVTALAKVAEDDFGDNAQAVANQYFFGYAPTASRLRQYMGVSSSVSVSDFTMYKPADGGDAPYRFTAKVHSDTKKTDSYVDGYYDSQAQQFKIADVVLGE